MISRNQEPIVLEAAFKAWHPHEAIAWDDLRVPASATTLVAGTGTPATPTVNAGSRIAFNFIEGNTDYVWFTAQLPHGYKEGTDIVPHVHWFPVVAGTSGQEVRWSLSYSWTNVGDTFPVVSTIHATTIVVGDVTTQFDHCITAFDALDGTGKEISSMLLCGLFRNSGHANDTLAEDAAMVEVDFHFQMNSMGSQGAFTK